MSTRARTVPQYQCLLQHSKSHPGLDGVVRLVYYSASMSRDGVKPITWSYISIVSMFFRETTQRVKKVFLWLLKARCSNSDTTGVSLLCCNRFQSWSNCSSQLVNFSIESVNVSVTLVVFLVIIKDK